MELEMSTKSESIEFERVRLEEGVYEAELKEVKDITEGTYGPRVAFIYIVDSKELAYVCYKTKATEDNKLGKALIAHGVKIQDTKVNTDNLPKNKVRVWVEDFKVRDKDGKETKEIASTVSKVKQFAEEVKV